MSKPNQFHIREASTDDAAFILGAFDSAIPHLASIGSSAQWGSAPLSSNARFVNDTNEAVAQSAAYRADGKGDPVYTFIAEVETEDGSEQGRVPVAAAIAKEDWFPKYITSQEHLQGHLAEAKNVMFLKMLVSDFRTGDKRKGAGAALVQRVKEVAVEKGKSAYYLDCWSGNGRNLVEFYKKQGFVELDDFTVKDVKPDGDEPWPGCFLRMSLES